MLKVYLDQPTYRLVSSVYPPKTLFDHLLDPEELEYAYALEGMTNDRLRVEVGDIALVRPEDRLVGDGTTPIMAAFTHCGTDSRFCLGTFGIYYAGLSLQTAIEESRHSRARFLSATNEEPQIVTMRSYICTVRAEMVDLRQNAKVHDPDDWEYAQIKGAQMIQKGEMGAIYKSVRHPGGECIAAFRPTALVPPAVQSKHYQYHWDGKKISHVVAFEDVDIATA
ncbi:MAG: RES domain-containing protein [Gammaproteobacteria bacterium]|nr:MAG: RES domain-containing protein [Gammaproteobacteria bacterium]